MGQFERTLIIADEGSSVHYVEGCTAPIYSTAQPAQRRGRDHRQEGRPRPLHDDPELVEQRLQPRHQARRGLRGRGHGVGGRQPRLEGHDEVPERLPDGERRARRGPLASPSPATASTRTRAARSSTPRRTRPRHHLASPSARAPAARATAACSRSTRGLREVEVTVRCDALCSTRGRAPTRTRTWRSTRRT
jgi:hypothetical protein